VTVAFPNVASDEFAADLGKCRTTAGGRVRASAVRSEESRARTFVANAGDPGSRPAALIRTVKAAGISFDVVSMLARAIPTGAVANAAAAQPATQCVRVIVPPMEPAPSVPVVRRYRARVPGPSTRPASATR